MSSNKSIILIFNIITALFLHRRIITFFSWSLDALFGCLFFFLFLSFPRTGVMVNNLIDNIIGFDVIGNHDDDHKLSES